MRIRPLSQLKQRQIGKGNYRGETTRVMELFCGVCLSRCLCFVFFPIVYFLSFFFPFHRQRGAASASPSGLISGSSISPKPRTRNSPIRTGEWRLSHRLRLPPLATQSINPSDSVNSDGTWDIWCIDLYSPKGTRVRALVSLNTCAVPERHRVYRYMGTCSRSLFMHPLCNYCSVACLRRRLGFRPEVPCLVGQGSFA